MSDKMNSTGKVMTSVILNAFAGERNPLFAVSRTLGALEQVEERTIKAENKGNMMQSLAQHIAAELKPDSKDSTTETSKLDTFMAEQAKINKKLLAKLK